MISDSVAGVSCPSSAFASSAILHRTQPNQTSEARSKEGATTGASTGGSLGGLKLIALGFDVGPSTPPKLPISGPWLRHPLHHKTPGVDPVVICCLPVSCALHALAGQPPCQGPRAGCSMPSHWPIHMLVRLPSARRATEHEKGERVCMSLHFVQ